MRSPYVLDLRNSPYDYVIACELLLAAGEYHRCEIFDISFQASLSDKELRLALDFSPMYKKLVECGTTKIWEISQTGFLRVSARYIPSPVAVSPEITSDGLIALIKVIKDRTSSREKSSMLDVSRAALIQ